MSEDAKLSPPFIRSSHFKQFDGSDTIPIPAAAVSLDVKLNGVLLLRMDRETFLNLARNNGFDVDDVFARKHRELLHRAANTLRKSADDHRNQYRAARSKLFEW